MNKITYLHFIKLLNLYFIAIVNYKFVKLNYVKLFISTIYYRPHIILATIVTDVGIDM